MTQAEARAFLEARYRQQVAKYSRLARIPLKVYVSRNLKPAMRYLTPESDIVKSAFGS